MRIDTKYILLDYSGFSADGILISASAEPHRCSMISLDSDPACLGDRDLATAPPSVQSLDSCKLPTEDLQEDVLSLWLCYTLAA